MFIQLDIFKVRGKSSSRNKGSVAGSVSECSCQSNKMNKLGSQTAVRIQLQ